MAIFPVRHGQIKRLRQSGIPTWVLGALQVVFMPVRTQLPTKNQLDARRPLGSSNGALLPLLPEPL